MRVERSNTIIAIDGYSSCGKSTLAKALAQSLGYVYIDTGAMYRAVTLYFQRHAIPFDNEQAVSSALKDINIDFSLSETENLILLNGEDVTDAIRTMQVSDQVSEVSAIKAVRQAMVNQQQALGAVKDVVMDGRDIGTTVFPDAALKIFMTADPKIRAKRRFSELQAKGVAISFDEVFNNLAHRDHIDTTRSESPLIQASDAIVLDNSNMTREEQLRFVLKLVK